MFILTLLLSFFSYKKWRQVDTEIIGGDTIRSWKDTLVQITILVEFFQFVAIAPAFSSLQAIVEGVSNIFMLDVIKVAQGDQSSYWNLLIVICIVCYIWFFLVVFIICSSGDWVSVLQRALGFFNAFYLPFVGNTMFLPLLLYCLTLLCVTTKPKDTR